jgi:hypothetical protein
LASTRFTALYPSRFAPDSYGCPMWLWRGDYRMRMATVVPFFVVSQLIARGHYHDSVRLCLAMLFGLLAAVAGWSALTVWRRGHHDHGESTLCCETSNPTHGELRTVTPVYASPITGLSGPPIPAQVPPGGSSMTATKQLASVVVERPKRGRYLDMRDRWRSYWIEVDGQRVGKLRLGERLVIPVAAGRHIAQARISRTGSPKVHVYLHNGGEIILRVHPAGSPLDTSQVFTKDKWLALHVAIDE